MSIRFRKYVVTHTAYDSDSIMAVKITLKNIPELVAHICTRGGAATGHVGDTKSGHKARIRLKQHTFGKGWTKRDWRVARVGDYIVRTKDGDYRRIKGGAFEEHCVRA